MIFVRNVISGVVLKISIPLFLVICSSCLDGSKKGMWWYAFFLMAAKK